MSGDMRSIQSENYFMKTSADFVGYLDHLHITRKVSINDTQLKTLLMEPSSGDGINASQKNKEENSETKTSEPQKHCECKEIKSSEFEEDYDSNECETLAFEYDESEDDCSGEKLLFKHENKGKVVLKEVGHTQVKTLWLEQFPGEGIRVLEIDAYRQNEEGNESKDSVSQKQWEDIESQEDKESSEIETITFEKCDEIENEADCSGESDEKKEKGFLKEMGLFALKTAVISSVVLGGATIALPAIGYGTLAPITLESFYTVGLSVAVKTAIVASRGTVSQVATSAYRKITGNDKKEDFRVKYSRLKKNYR